MSRGAGESKEYRTSDTVLVRIAERPLVVAGLFLFTALFPWVVYFLVPFLARATLLDLIQCLTLPILFILVNGLLFFLWMNHQSKSTVSATQDQYGQDQYGQVHLSGLEEDVFRKPSHLTGLEEDVFRKPSHLTGLEEDVFRKPSHLEEDVFRKPSHLTGLEEDVFMKPRSIDIPPPQAEPPTMLSSGSEYNRLDQVAEEEEDEKVSIPSVETSPEPVKKLHKKSHSLGGDVQLDPKLLEDLLISIPSANVSRRHSTPKLKTPVGGPESGKHRVSRRNSSPKSVTPSSIRFENKRRSATLHGETAYTPPVRIRQQPPVPLDKDDLNDRIEDFLTKFKIERQESNLRAALKSQ